MILVLREELTIILSSRNKIRIHSGAIIEVDTDKVPMMDHCSSRLISYEEEH